MYNGETKIEIDKEENDCYICFDKVENPIKFCECQKICHLECLHRWIREQDNQVCDICKKEYIDLDRYYTETKVLPIKNKVKILLYSLLIAIVSALIIYVIIKNISNLKYLAAGIVFVVLSSIYLLLHVKKYFNKDLIIRVKIKGENTQLINQENNLETGESRPTDALILVEE